MQTFPQPPFPLLMLDPLLVFLAGHREGIVQVEFEVMMAEA